MPETPVKESRLPELHLPEINRDEIVRALSEIRLPEVDLSKIQMPSVEMADIRRAVEDAATRVGVRERSRRRWPILAGAAVLLSVGAMTLLRRPAVRLQMEATARKARARIEQMRLERERATGSLSVEEIEKAVGEAGSNGHEPVAVGPGRKTRRRAKDAIADEAEAVTATASDATEAEDATASDEAVIGADEAVAMEKPSA